jgi:hypothetical protein
MKIPQALKDNQMLRMKLLRQLHPQEEQIQECDEVGIIRDNPDIELQKQNQF